MAMHKVFIPAFDARIGGQLVVGGDEAQHAIRVKRITVGERVEILDGAGRMARGAVSETRKSGKSGWELVVNIESETRVERTRPWLDVCAAIPKGDRVGDMIDQLSQVGAARWSPLVTDRAVADSTDAKIERLTRRAMEASKQCGRAWALEIGDQVTFAAALVDHSKDTAIVLADASGGPYSPTGAGRIRLLVGPEGGWTESELAKARHAGVAIARFAPHIMRVETAAVAAAVAIIDGETNPRAPHLSR